MTLRRAKRAACVAAALLAATILAAVTTVARAAWKAPTLVVARLGPPPVRTARTLTPDRLRALLEVEDPRFFTHRGVDLRTPGAGWTTISQALVKFLYFERFEPGPLAKLEQTLLAIGFDAATSKQMQLDLFWNHAYLGSVDGQDVTGFPRAASAYFSRDVDDLERREYLALVAMLVAPNRLSIAREPAANAERVRRIERLLAGECRPAEWRDVDLAGCR